MENTRIWCFLSIFIKVVTRGAFSQQWPSDQTVFVGENVTFECLDANITSWIMYPNIWLITVLANGNIIYDLPGYDVTATNGLAISNVQLTDANTYQCATTGTSRYAANLVVLGFLYPPTESPDFPQVIGSQITVTCSLEYGAPNNTVRPLSSLQDPQITMTVGPYNLTTTTTTVIIIEDNSTDYIAVNYSIKAATANVTLTSALAGQTINCTATSVTVGVQTTLQQSGNTLPYSPQHMQINVSLSKPNTFTVNVRRGTVVNCSADGDPLPTVYWFFYRGNASSDNTLEYAIAPGWALLYLDTPGTVVWNCSAANNEYLSPMLTTTYTFNVKNECSKIQFSIGSVIGAILFATLSTLLKDVRRW